MVKQKVFNFIFITICLIATRESYAQLRISNNQRHLVNPDGTPFFWLGDTGWELFHRLTREEADFYLKTRAGQGFNVVQAVVLAEFDGLHTPNAYGETPFMGDDPLKPREAYFEHVDYIINLAAKYKIYIGLLPTWGDKVFKDRWGAGPEIFNEVNAYSYGKWIGERYKSKKNIIWILGGDRAPRNDHDVTIWRKMAIGIQDGVGGKDHALMTFHPQPNGIEDGGSAKWFHQDDWLDINMFQTGHCRENNVWDRIEVAYNKEPVKPVIDGEPIYEDHPVCFNAKELGTSSAFDVRKNAYLDVFSGTCGHTYGCHDIWQFYDSTRIGVNGPHVPWKTALNLPGANQMKYLKHLMESRPILDRVPDATLVINRLYEHNRIQTCRGRNYIMVYSSEGFPFEILLGTISGTQLQSYWYDPRSGKSIKSDLVENIGIKKFAPPSKGYGQDWVLILDDLQAKYTDPGFVSNR